LRRLSMDHEDSLAESSLDRVELRPSTSPAPRADNQSKTARGAAPIGRPYATERRNGDGPAALHRGSGSPVRAPRRALRRPRRNRRRIRADARVHLHRDRVGGCLSGDLGELPVPEGQVPLGVEGSRESAWASLRRAVAGTDKLLTLQEIDSAIDRLAVRRRALEGGDALAALRGEADVAERAFGELRLQLDAMNRDQLRYEHEIDSISQKIVAEEKRLFDGSIANAKELESIQHEVDNLKRRRSDREDELLALLEQREVLEARAAEAESATTVRRTSADEGAAAAADELRHVEAELGERTAEREALVPQLDPEVVELY